MELRLLGPVEVCTGQRVFDVGPPQRRAVLAALAAAPGRHVSTDVLVDRVWGDRPPGAARRSLQAHLSRIRRVFEQAGGGVEAPGPVRRSDGYLLDMDPRRVDLHRFRLLVREARGHPVGDGRRLVALRRAVALWREDALAGLPGEWARQARGNWECERLDAMVLWGEAEIAHGNTGDVITRLSDLALDHPTSESLAATLIQALRLVGRRAEALSRFTQTRRSLLREFGAEPGRELQLLHRLLLRCGSSPEPSVGFPGLSV